MKFKMIVNRTNNTENGYDSPAILLQPKDCGPATETLFFILYAITGTTIFIGNTFACAVFLTNEKLCRSKMNVFLISLAAWDTLMSTLVVPFYAVYCGLGCEYALVRYCWLMRGAKDFVKIGSTLNLYAITYDRYLAVLQPLHYRSKQTPCRITTILGFVWLLPLLLAGIRNTWQHFNFSENTRLYNKIYDSAMVLGIVVVLVIVMATTNVRILRVISKQAKRDKQEFPGRVTTERHKGTISCVIVVLVFVVCWIPRAVYNFSFIIHPPGLTSPLFFWVCFLFLFLQSSVNPFVYWFFRVEFRYAATALVRRYRRKERTAPFLNATRNDSFLLRSQLVLDFPNQPEIELTFFRKIPEVTF